MYVEAGRRITLLCGIEIGRRLVEAKEMLQHGEWLPWLEKETGFSTSSAQRYMAGMVKMAPAARDSPAEEIVCTMLFSSMELRRIKTRRMPMETTAAGIDADTVSPTLSPR